MPQAASTPQDAMVAIDVYQRQLEVISRQVDLLQSAFDETVRARRSLEGLAEEKAADILLPVGASTFLRATIADRDAVISGIGAGYATELPREKAVQQLSQREESIRGEIESLMQSAVQIQQEMERLQDAVEDAGAAQR